MKRRVLHAAGGVLLLVSALTCGGGNGGTPDAPTAPGPTPTPTPIPGEMRIVSVDPPYGSEIELPPALLGTVRQPEILFEVVYGADVAEATWNINLWSGDRLCLSTQDAYADRLDSRGRAYSAGTAARYRVRFWTGRSPGCEPSDTIHRLQFFWGWPGQELFAQDLEASWVLIPASG